MRIQLWFLSLCVLLLIALTVDGRSSDLVSVSVILGTIFFILAVEVESLSLRSWVLGVSAAWYLVGLGGTFGWWTIT